MKKRVVIVQEHLPVFRIAFYEELRRLLACNDIELVVVYADNQQNTFVKGTLNWALNLPIKYVMGWKLQRLNDVCRDADLMVFQQEIRYINSWLCIFRRKLGGHPSALWGHGKNFQAKRPRGGVELIKAWLSRKVDWWFAYNDACVDVIKSLGFDGEKITSVVNSIDAKALRAAFEKVTLHDVERVRKQYDISGNNVCLFVGGMYELKRIPFLIDAAHRIKQLVPDFELVMIGDGPGKKQIYNGKFLKGTVRYIGPLLPEQQGPIWKMSKALLMPGAVGLVAVDTFVYGVPMITTNWPYHGPEFAYLTPGRDSIVVDDYENVEAYANAVVSFLQSKSLRVEMSQRAYETVEAFSAENMAERFFQGIEKVLG
jgi:glycosyltransferase involved in cell wall biosynthesis